MNLEFDRQLGENLRRLRKSRHMTQDQLAAKLQVRGCVVTRSALAKMEVGPRYLYADEIRLLKEILQCSHEDLFGEQNH